MIIRNKVILLLVSFLITSCDTLDVVKKTSVYPNTDNLFVCAREAIDANDLYQVDPLTVRYGVGFDVSNMNNMSFSLVLKNKRKKSEAYPSEADVLTMTSLQGPAQRMYCEAAETYKAFMQDVDNIIQQHCGVKSIDSDFEINCKS